MADGAQITVAPAAAEPAVEMVNLLRALGNPVRWEVLRLLATEGPLSVTVLAARTDRAQHSMSKHLQVLRAVGAVVMVAVGTATDKNSFTRSRRAVCVMGRTARRLTTACVCCGCGKFN